MIQRKPTRIELKPQDKDEVQLHLPFPRFPCDSFTLGSFVRSSLPRGVKKRRKKRLQSFLERQNRRTSHSELAILDRVVVRSFDRI